MIKCFRFDIIRLLINILRSLGGSIMKKTILTFILILLLLFSTATCAHQHQWGEWVTVKDYSCSTSGLKERVCECGEKESEVIAPAHDYKDGICIVCNVKKGSDGLEFALNLEETSYTVKLGTATDEHIVIPSMYNSLPVDTIDDFGFNTTINSIDIPDSIRIIKNYAFYKCENLKSVVIPDSVVEIGEDAFANCYNLEQVILPKNITEIPTRMFMGCDSLRDVVIPNSVTSIGYSAFSSCTSLRSIVIPDSVESIAEFAFSHCYYLTRVTLGEKLEKIGVGAFGACYKLVEIVNLSPIYLVAGSMSNGQVSNYALNIYTSLEDDFQQYVDEKGFMFCKSENQLYLIGYLGSDSHIELPTTQESYIIRTQAFEEDERLISVIISDSVTKIESFVFYNCNNLIHVTISDSVTYMSVDIFGECDNLKEVIFLDYNNWGWSKYHYDTKGTPISPDTLKKSDEAAILLRITHHNHYWIKN